MAFSARDPEARTSQDLIVNFTAPGKNSKLYDPTLTDTAEALNAVLRVASFREDDDRRVGFLINDAGITLVWDIVVKDGDEYPGEYGSEKDVEELEDVPLEELARILDVVLDQGPDSGRSEASWR